tara:strand:- start:557 stop:1159 length:603 start_codon:yes stop_codon:yes gene_type:complete
MTKKAVVFSDSRRKTYEKIIKEQTQEKKRELHRAIDGLVDKQIDKKFNLFLKDLKIKKALDKHKKTCEDLDVFERNLENKKKQLEEDKLKSGQAVEDIFSRQAKINDWSTSIYEEDTHSEIERKLNSICRDEIVKQLNKSTPQGKELENIDNQVNNFLLTLSYPHLVAEEVDLNKALASGSSMLSIALNPNTLKRIEGGQ